MEQGYYRKKLPTSLFFLKLAPTQRKTSIVPRRIPSIRSKRYVIRELGRPQGTAPTAKPSIPKRRLAIRGLGGAHGASPHFHDARV